MAKRGRIEIPAPLAQPWDLVWVPNYRRVGEPLERGKVVDATYDISVKSWSYRIRLLRESGAGNPIFLHVGDNCHAPRPCTDEG